MRMGKVTLAVAVLLAIAGSVQAQTASVADTIKTRQANMKQMGGAMKALAEMAKSGAVDKAAATENAKKIDTHAQVLGDWFPKGSGTESGAETKAKAEIWAQGDDFKKAAADLKVESAKLVTAAATGDAAVLGPQLAATGKTCSGCHTKFQNK